MSASKKDNSHKRFSLLGKLSSSTQPTASKQRATNSNTNTKTNTKTNTNATGINSNGIANTAAINKKITIHLPDSGHNRSHSNGEKLLSSDLNNNINSFEKFGYTVPSLPSSSPNRNSLDLLSQKEDETKTNRRLDPSPFPSSSQRKQQTTPTSSNPSRLPQSIVITDLESNNSHNHNNNNNIITKHEPTPLSKSPKPLHFPPLPPSPAVVSPVSPISPIILNDNAFTNTGMLNRSTSTLNSTSSSFYPSIHSSTDNFHESKTSIQSSTYPYSYQPLQHSLSTKKRDAQYLLEQQQQQQQQQQYPLIIASNNNTTPPPNRPLSKPPANTYNLSIRRKPPPPLTDTIKARQDISPRKSPITPTLENHNPLSNLSSPSITTTPPQNLHGDGMSPNHHPSLRNLPPIPKDEEEHSEESIDRSVSSTTEEPHKRDDLLLTIESEIQALRPQESTGVDDETTQKSFLVPLEHPSLGNSAYSLASSKATTPLNFGNAFTQQADNYFTPPSNSQSKEDEYTPGDTRKLKNSGKFGITQSPSITNFQEVLKNYKGDDDDNETIDHFVQPPNLQRIITDSPQSGISTTDDEEFYDVPSSFEERDEVAEEEQIDSFQRDRTESMAQSINTAPTTITNDVSSEALTRSSLDEKSDDLPEFDNNEATIPEEDIDITLEEANIRRLSYISRDSHEMISSEDESSKENETESVSEAVTGEAQISTPDRSIEDEEVRSEEEFSFHTKSVTSSPQFQRHGLQIFTPLADDDDPSPEYSASDVNQQPHQQQQPNVPTSNINKNNGEFYGDHYLHNAEDDLDEDEDDDDDEVTEDNDLSFTAVSPYYTRFDFNDENEPKRTMMVVNPSDNSSDDDDDEEEEEEGRRNITKVDDSYSIGDDDLEELYPTSKNSNVDTRPESPVIPPVKFPIPSSYDRREQPTIIPLTHTDMKHNSNSKTLPRRPPPDFPSIGRNTRSISDVTAQSDMFENVKTTGTLDDQNLLKSAKDRSRGNSGVGNIGDEDFFNETINQVLSKANNMNKTLDINNKGNSVNLEDETENIPEQLKQKGVKSVYITHMRKRASASYSESVPSIKVLPIAIRPKSRSVSHRRINSNSQVYSSHSRTHSKNGGASFNMSDAAIKHGGLKTRTRMLASEIDDDELPDSKLYHDADQTKKPTDPDAYVLEAAEQLKRLASPYLDKSPDLSLGEPNTTSLNRFASVRSARRFGSVSGNEPSKRFTLFIANPDGSDSD